MSSLVISSLTTLFNKLGSDDLKVLQPIADGYLTNVAAQPNLVNDAAQTAAFEAQVVGALPGLEQTDVADAANALKTLLDQEATAVQATLNPSNSASAAPQTASQ